MFKVGQTFVSKILRFLISADSTGWKYSNGGKLNPEYLSNECLGNEHQGSFFKKLYKQDDFEYLKMNVCVHVRVCVFGFH